MLLAIGLLSIAGPAAAQLTIFEALGITLGDDPVECQDLTTYRLCESDLGSERVLSHDALAIGDRVPLDFHLFLPPVPVSGDDGLYPLVVFLHGWNGSRDDIGGSLQSEFIPYAEAGYAVLAYSARAWANSCGSTQQANPECTDQWNHLADVRYEVRDTQYFAGLLADELSDDGTFLVDPNRIGVTGVSYGGGQSTILTGLRNRVVDPDGTIHPWTSPAGKPMQIAAAAPFWAWTDLAYSLLPNGRNLDYAVNNSYRGPLGGHPFGVMKQSYVSGLYATGQMNSVYAPAGSEPDLNDWYSKITAGEPAYTEATIGVIVDEIVAHHAGYYWIDETIEPAPTLFNSGWSDDLFPVTEPVRWIARATHLHPGLAAAVAASDYGHARATSADAAWAKARSREWFDHHLMGIGPLPGPAIRAREQDCGNGAIVHTAATWKELAPGEVRLQSATGGSVLSSAGGSAAASNTFDPIAPPTDPCERVEDTTESGTVVFDFPAAGAGGYTVLGSPTVIADLSVTGIADHAIVVARLLEVDPSGDEQLLSRAAYRPDASGQQVFQLTPIAHFVPAGHHLQVDLLGHEAPTSRQSSSGFSVDVANADIRVPVAEAPDGGQITVPAPKLVPPGYLLGSKVPSAGPLLLTLLVAGMIALAARLR